MSDTRPTYESAFESEKRRADELSSRVNPDRMNWEELTQYYHVRGFFGEARLKMKLLKNYLLQNLAESPPHTKITIFLQRMRGVNIGENVYIGHHVEIDSLYPHLVTIEDNVSIGTNCMIFAHSNPTSSIWLKRNRYPRYVAPVRIKRGAWIPPGTIILPGVTIGECAVVGAGSLVAEDVEPFTLVAGHPARLKKRLI